MKYFAIVLLLLANEARADEVEILRRLDAIEKRLTAMESANPLGALFKQRLENMQKAGDAAADGKTDLTLEPPPFSVKLLGLKSAGKDILGHQGVEIRVAVTNESARGTDIVNAQVVFEDRAGNTLLRVKWDKNRGIAAGKTVNMQGAYTATLRSDGIETLLEIDRSLLAITFDVYKIAFTGGEVTEFKECLMCDF